MPTTSPQTPRLLGDRADQLSGYFRPRKTPEQREREAQAIAALQPGYIPPRVQRAAEALYKECVDARMVMIVDDYKIQVRHQPGSLVEVQATLNPEPPKELPASSHKRERSEEPMGLPLYPEDTVLEESLLPLTEGDGDAPSSPVRRRVVDEHDDAPDGADGWRPNPHTAADASPNTRYIEGLIE